MDESNTRIKIGISKTMTYISLTMPNLIIHPKDPSTHFLSPIYAPIKNKTVIDGGVTKSNLRKLIHKHDRVIMMGHGTPYGLLAVDQFPDIGAHIVDESMVGILKRKTENIYIWCNADLFVQLNYLDGLYSGFFISEIEEAKYYGFHDISREIIDESNNGFASIMAKHINEPLPFFYRKLICEYGLMARTNPIAQFNLVRLYLTSAGMNLSHNMVGIFNKSINSY